MGISSEEYREIMLQANEAVAQAVLDLEKAMDRLDLSARFQETLQASSEHYIKLEDSRVSTARQKALNKDALDSQFRGISVAIAQLQRKMT